MGILKYWFVPLTKLFVYEAKGFEHIPKQGPVIITANHQSYIDGPLIAMHTDWYRNRWVRGIIYRGIYEKNWFLYFFCKYVFNQIPTDGAVKKVLEALQNNDTILLFPEGERTRTGKIQKATHKGLGVLASLTKAPVIPIGVKGTYQWWSRHQFLPSLFKFRCLSIRVGKPLYYKGKPTKKNHLAFQRKVMKEIAKLARTTYPY